MARWTRLMLLIRATLASSVALSAAGVTKAEAQSASASAYRQAKQIGTISALEQFIEAYPLSPEANAAFRDIVVLSRRSTLVDDGPSGLTPAMDGDSPSRGVSAY